MRKIQTELECPLCHSPVEIGVRDRGYHGHTNSRDDVPEKVLLSGVRRMKDGTFRYGYWMKGYIPMCSNRACFLHGSLKQFRSQEEAEGAWEERAKIW